MDSSPREYTETPPQPADGIIGGIAGAFSSARRVAGDLLRLFSLEVRRAGLTLVWMVALGTMAALLMVTAWLGLMGALALWAVSLGLTWVSALLGLALINLITAALVIYFLISLSRNLLFPATRRQLEATPAQADAP